MVPFSGGRSRQRVAERAKSSNGDLPRLEAEATVLRGKLVRLTEAVSISDGELAPLVKALKDRQDELIALEARIAQSKTAPSGMLTEVKRLEKEAKKRLTDLQGTFERNPQEARRLMETLLKGKLTFTPTERPAGKRYRVEGKLTLGGVLSTTPGASVPYYERPQGDSNLWAHRAGSSSWPSCLGIKTFPGTRRSPLTVVDIAGN